MGGPAATNAFSSCAVSTGRADVALIEEAHYAMQYLERGSISPEGVLHAAGLQVRPHHPHDVSIDCRKAPCGQCRSTEARRVESVQSFALP